MARPVIAVLLDYQESGSFSARPHYALRRAYFDAVWAAGGLPVGAPYLDGGAAEYLSLAQGFVLPGGFYPFPAAWYGAEAPENEVLHPRFVFETRLCRALLDADKPVLGVCAGMQVMAGVLGGTLYRDVREDPGAALDHLSARPAEEAAHRVTLEPGARLREITGADTLDVNSAHAEALRAVPPGAVLNATSEDGLIEGIEIPGARFAVGVQWHPEFFTAPGDPNRALFEALTAAAAAA